MAVRADRQTITKRVKRAKRKGKAVLFIADEAERER